MWFRVMLTIGKSMLELFKNVNMRRKVFVIITIIRN